MRPTVRDKVHRVVDSFPVGTEFTSRDVLAIIPGQRVTLHQVAQYLSSRCDLARRREHHAYVWQKVGQ